MAKYCEQFSLDCAFCSDSYQCLSDKECEHQIMLNPTGTEIFLLKQLKQQIIQNNEILEKLKNLIEKQNNQR